MEFRESPPPSPWRTATFAPKHPAKGAPPHVWSALAPLWLPGHHILLGDRPEGGKVVLVEHRLGQRVGRPVNPTRIAPRIDDASCLPSAHDGHDLRGVDQERA